MNHRVAVSGMGCISPLGAGTAEFRRGLEAGRSAVEQLDLFDVSKFRSGMAARVRDICRPPAIAASLWRNLDRCDRMALVALEEALESAQRPDVSEAALCCGMSTAGMFEAEQRALRDPGRGLLAIGPRAMLDTIVSSTTDVVARHIRCQGPVHTVSTACSSSAHAIGTAMDLIRSGEVDIAIAGGADALCRLTLAGFNSLGVVAADRPRPFDARRSGMVLGEGAAFLVLESEDRLRRRGLEPSLEVCGYASTAEAHHIVHPLDDGSGAERAMRWALEDAGETPERVDHVNAHGTATSQNDIMETAAIRRLFGERGTSVPVTSTKSIIGHTTGASGALEAVASFIAIESGFVAPTAGYGEPDPRCEADVVHGEPRRGRFDLVVSNSFAFGGNDVSLVLGRWRDR